MALKTLNSVGGFGVGADSNVVIYANSDIHGNIIVANASVNTLDLNVTGLSNLGHISNVKILGGTEHQVISTDGNGNLSFTTVSTTGGMMPYYIPEGETYTVSVNKQGLFSIPITVDGTLEVEGILVQV